MNAIQKAACALLMFALVFTVGCPDKKTTETQKADVKTESVEKDAIEKWAETTGKQAADKLQEPIDKAREAAEQMDKRIGDITDKLDE